MTLYHGSYKEITHPDIVHSRNNVDFGRGFYTTPLLEQAQKWSRKFKAKKKTAIISIYELDNSILEKCKVQKFDYYSEEWLNFVLNCRRGQDNSDFDVVMGGVVNDKVFNTVELFFEGLIDKTEALKRLRYEKPNFQVAFRSQYAIDQYLKFKRSESI